MELVERTSPQAPAHIEALLTPPEVCAVLRIKLTTLYAWCRRGKIRYVKVGGLLRFRRSDLPLRPEQSKG